MPGESRAATSYSDMSPNVNYQFGQKAGLVPYEECHVEPYHEWMKDPWIQGHEAHRQTLSSIAYSRSRR